VKIRDATKDDLAKAAALAPEKAGPAQATPK
jgi:hypothetical protein